MTTAATELELVRILPIQAIMPAPENTKVYRPIDPNDPGVRALALSIMDIGLQEPIVVSSDGFILSGHRRYTAAQMAGLSEVPCRVHDVSHDEDPDEFMKLLVSFNRQRVKSLDEQVREEVIATDPEEAYQALLEQRRQASRVHADPLEMGEVKARAEITRAKEPMLTAIIRVLDERRDYWPLSDRQIHYALLNDPPLRHASKPTSTYCNDRPSYKALCDLLARARLDELIPWAAIADPTRPITLWDVYSDTGSFVRKYVDGFLKGYWRDLMRSQPNHIEILAEKNTIVPIVRQVAAQYRIPMTSGRGFCSLPPRHEMAERFRRSGKERLVVLILSDHDPDGEMIASSFARSVRDDFGIESITPIKVALTAAQVRQFRLPKGPKAKTGSPNYTRFVAEHGQYVHELEAMQPQDLQKVLRKAIESVIDRNALNHEVAMEKKDAAELQVLRQRVQSTLLECIGD